MIIYITNLVIYFLEFQKQEKLKNRSNAPTTRLPKYVS